MLKPGDRILEANGTDLRNTSVDEAAAFMMVRERVREGGSEGGSE